MKKLISILLFVSILFVSGKVSATSYGEVKDNNDGTVGQILVNTGIDSGSTDIGHWTNPTDIPGLKGAKGDTGATGATGPQGVQGIKGDIGAQGSQGIQGLIGTQGVKGDTGLQGVQGDLGANGVNGKDGATGLQGDKGDKGDQGIQGFKGDIGFTGAQGVSGLNGKDVDPATVNKINNTLDKHETRIGNLEQISQQQSDAINKLQQTKLLMEQDIRLYDGKRTTIAAFNSYDLNAGHGFAQGLRITFKPGTSYEERLFKKQQDTLKEIQYVNFELSKQVAQAKAMVNHINNLTYKTVVIQEKVNSKGHVLSRKIITSGLR